MTHCPCPSNTLRPCPIFQKQPSNFLHRYFFIPFRPLAGMVVDSLRRPCPANDIHIKRSVFGQDSM